MNNPVFCKQDFRLCIVEVPQGYPQSQTHAGIAYYDKKYYLTCSPYPAKKSSLIDYYWHSLLRKISFGKLGNAIDADSYENPLLYIGIPDGDNPPLAFSPVAPFPLMGTPEPVYGLPAYNSDPDIFIEDGNVYILNRSYYRKTEADGSIGREVIISLIKGYLDSEGYHLNDIVEFRRSQESLISPCLTKYNGKYLFTSLETNCANDGHTYEGLYVQQADALSGLKDDVNKSKISFIGGNMLPWHMSLFTYQEKLYAIVACVCKGDKTKVWQMLGVFDQDLTTLRLFPRPLTDYNSYRGAAIVVDGEFVLYTTTVNDRLPDSKSVDGRDIIMVKSPMNEVLAKVKE